MGAYLLPLGAVLIWSVNTVVSKLAADSISAAEIGFFRWLVAAVLFTPFVLPSIWRQRADIKPLLPRILVLGVLGMVIYQSLAYYAAHYTTATHMGIIGSLTPMLVLALAVFMLGQPLTHGGIWGSLLAIAGVALVVSSGRLSHLASEGLNLGDAMMFLAMLAYAVYNILLKRWPMPRLATVQLLYLQVLVAVIVQFPLYLFSPKTGLDASNLPLEIVDVKQSGCRAAAICAAVGAGEYSDFQTAMKHCQPPTLRLEPNPAKHVMLRKRFERFKQIAQALSEVK